MSHRVGCMITIQYKQKTLKEKELTPINDLNILCELLKENIIMKIIKKI